MSILAQPIPRRALVAFAALAASVALLLVTSAAPASARVVCIYGNAYLHCYDVPYDLDGQPNRDVDIGSY
jgi:hypothetical protein